MKLILLPGNAKDNRIWSTNVHSLLKKHIEPENIFILEYLHWNFEDKNINLEVELKRLIEIINNLDEDYVIFAKTAGVSLALKGIHEKKINPCKCIFFGVPIMWSRFNNYKIDKWFEKYEHPTLFIQKSGDPDFYYDELVEYLQDKTLKDYNIIKIKGNDKKYFEIEDIEDEILNYMKDIKIFCPK